MDLFDIRREVSETMAELIEAAGLKSGHILVLGCSTSEVVGRRIGTSGSLDVARPLLEEVLKWTRPRRIQLAVQCCEHLNRALVVESSLLEKGFLTEVAAYPVPGAGGALAAMAMKLLETPVLVESIQAHAGLDIGSTLIGMHLKAVAVPLRLKRQTIGHARLTAARTRPKLIGGARARYEPECE